MVKDCATTGFLLVVLEIFTTFSLDTMILFASLDVPVKDLLQTGKHIL